MEVAIIGAGPGNEALLTLEAREAIGQADLVLATDRLYQALGHLNPHTVCASLSQIPAILGQATACRTAAVLVSGDCGFYSLGKTLPSQLRETMGDTLAIRLINGLNSMQYLCARVGHSYEDARVLSLHGRTGDIVPFVSYNAKVFALTGGAMSPGLILNQLLQADLGGVAVVVGACLGGPDETVLSGTAQRLATQTIPEPACLLILNQHSRNPHEFLTDSAFIRGKIPMTKSPVRTLALAALDIQPGDTVGDIGAGTGSVSIAMARKAFEGRVYAVERKAEALDLLARNRLALGAFNLTILPAEAPDGLEGLPPLDKAFIGGSGGNLAAIMRTLWLRNPGLRLAVTAITLESLHTALRTFQEHHQEPEITCVNVATARSVSRYHMMHAENPVYILASPPLN